MNVFACMRLHANKEELGCGLGKACACLHRTASEGWDLRMCFSPVLSMYVPMFYSHKKMNPFSAHVLGRKY